MFRQVLGAVSYAHEQGVIHRDIKPDNIIVGENGALRVIDLGIAKGTRSTATETGLAMGTVDYMAPEQHEDAKRVTERADVYSLAMTLYEMLAGRLPWDDSLDAVGILAAKRRGSLPPPSQFATGIPRQVVLALMPGLEPDPRRRYSSVDELCAALETAHFRTALAAEEKEAAEELDEPVVDEEDILETQPHIVLEQTESGRFESVLAAKEYGGSEPVREPTLPAVEEQPSQESAPAGAVAQFWRGAVDDSTPELPARLADLKARAKKRAKRPAPRPGRGGAVPLEHRRPKVPVFAQDPRARARVELLVFVLILFAGLGVGFKSWFGELGDLWALEERNENLLDEIEEQKLLAEEVESLMTQEVQLRTVLKDLEEAERKRRLPALALDRIEVSRPNGLLWIDSIEIGDGEFSVAAFMQVGSRADKLFVEGLEAGPLVSDVVVSSRVAVDRPGGPYEKIRVHGALGLPGLPSARPTRP